MEGTGGTDAAEGYREIVAALGDQHQELADLLAGLDADGWACPTPRCPGWTVREVVLHLSQTDEMAAASLRGTFDETLMRLMRDLPAAGSIDDGAARMVDGSAGLPASDVHEQWRANAAAVRSLFDQTDPSTRVQWVAGQLSARTLAATRIAECWIHTGDIAHGLGVERTATDRLRYIARLAWRTLPYAFAQAGRTMTGPVAFDLRLPSGTTLALVPDDAPLTTVTGDALDLCLVAGRRVDPSQTSLEATGPDASNVLALMRTYA